MTAHKSLPEAWEALRAIAADLSAGRMPDADQAAWFAAAVARCESDDAKKLSRELGVLALGRRLTVNPKAVASAVANFVRAGNSIMDSCEMAAKAHACNSKTAYRWYRSLCGGMSDGRCKAA